MKRRFRISKAGKGRDAKDVKYESDYQIEWSKYIPALKNFHLQSVDFLSISGDAPKDFITDKEYRPGHRSRRNPKDSFIATVGSKYYPLESIIEQFMQV